MASPANASNGTPENSDVSRREFIATASMIGAGALTLPAFYFSHDNPPEPPRAKETVKLGFIGVGSRGGALLRSMLKVPGSQIVAVADVSDEAVGAAVDNIADRDGKDVKEKIFQTNDYRELLKQDLQGVVIATPHFMHGPMAMDALEARKHVYVEKAMAFTIGECLDLYGMVKALGDTRVFQVGHQRHYSKLYRRVRDMVQEGVVGNVTAIRAQWNRNDQVARPSPDPKLERLVNWRLYSEYSGGLMTEFASHQIDVANMVLALPPASPAEARKILFPESVMGMGGMDYPRSKLQKGRDTSDNVHVIFTYRVPFRARQKQSDGSWAFVPTGETYPVRFVYMSLMTNELLGPTELIFGDEGTIEASLAGGDFWKEPKALGNPETNPASTYQKTILKTGATIAAVKKGIKPPDAEISVGKDRTDWSDFVGKITGEHSPQETLLALDGFLSDIRKCEKNEPFHVAANVDVGLGGAAAAIMGNIAMREQRLVTWKEFNLPDPS